MNTAAIADLTEALQVMETYNLSCLIWNFKDCQLKEVGHYEARGGEEIVLLCHRENSYLPYRLVFSPIGETEADDYIITLVFHEDYRIHIIRDPRYKIERHMDT
ncbi:hypothetical protein [Flavitalea sp.]|nr:hypothetical protein [Flavitalea sp.]